MDAIVRLHVDNLKITDKVKRYESFQYIIKLTRQPVDWAYEVWDDLLTLTKKGDNHQRAIAVQVLSNLAKSDPEQRLLKDLDKLLLVTKDEKFVTARHSLLCLWKVAIENNTLADAVIKGLSKRFKECIAEKNCTLIRYDITEVLRKIFNHTSDEKVKKVSLTLIETEKDEKYKKKYTGVWKDVLKPAKK